jgi:endonuclease III
MIITRIMTLLPKEYQYYSSAWDSTSSIDRTLDNLIRRLSLEEMKAKKILEAEEAVAFKAATKQ